jgi:hypothetical protein
LVGPRELEPVADELAHAHRNTEVGGEDRAQTVGVAHLLREEARGGELRAVRQTVTIAECSWCDTDEGSDESAKTVITRPVRRHGRLALRPGPIEERDESVRKDLEKA